jgi:WD40 repeat protein
MKINHTFSLIASFIILASSALSDEKPYITTQSPITLLSANDGETDIRWRKTPEGLNDREVKTEDSITVIHLGPDHPPITKTVYGTVPSSILGTPTMAMSADGRYGIIANHGFRGRTAYANLIYPAGAPVTNEDIQPGDLSKQKLIPQLSNMLSLIDLASPDLKVVDRVLLDDGPVHVLPHPDKKHFVVGAIENFYIFRIQNAKLIEISRNPQDKGLPCFWTNPKGDRIIATQGFLDGPATIHWYSLINNKVRHLSEVKINEGVDTELLDRTYILRTSLDGKLALVCQDSSLFSPELSDILIVDLTLDKPAITSVIKHVGPGVESFAFHPNGKMAVATCLGVYKNSIAVLDIASKPARLLYHLDAGGVGQGIEFTPEGDKLFVGSNAASRIEVYDVMGEFELRKNQKFLKIGDGHCNLTIGPRYSSK